MLMMKSIAIIAVAAISLSLAAHIPEDQVVPEATFQENEMVGDSGDTEADALTELTQAEKSSSSSSSSGGRGKKGKSDYASGKNGYSGGSSRVGAGKSCERQEIDELKSTCGYNSAYCGNEYRNHYRKDCCGEGSIVEVNEGTCKSHGLDMIVDYHECEWAIRSYERLEYDDKTDSGHTLHTPLHIGGYNDVVDGCSARGPFAHANNGIVYGFMNLPGSCNKRTANKNQVTWKNCECSEYNRCLCAYPKSGGAASSSIIGPGPKYTPRRRSGENGVVRPCTYCNQKCKDSLKGQLRL